MDQDDSPAGQWRGGRVLWLSHKLASSSACSPRGRKCPAGSLAMSRSVSSNRLSKPPDRGLTGHSPAREIVQSVFSLASQQRAFDPNTDLSGDAELKTDWTEPPTALNAMGFESSVS